jgi:hypothetical protein
MDDQQPISDDYLIQAARRRLLRQLEQEGGGAASIVNNVYGGPLGGGGGGMGGMMEAMGGGGGEDPFDYFVDINRRDVEEPAGLDENGQPIMKKVGWDKRVHRFRGSKKKDPMGPVLP